ncbi:MAG: sugar ABC transporter [Sedimenticola thiotaurini]|uniref:Sugar ABC transporter n=1 Tax=Sedimenticola thiotaurini TaxID=1543721 RepID=A0A558CPG7_9GAMM|nr:MAG: sugar ABC transporter [Sedimenticola thiotaurini]
MKIITALMLSLSLFTLSKQVSATDILVIESYNQEYSWDASYKKALIESLGDKYSLEFFQMDTKRLPVSVHQAQADKAWQLYKNKHPRIVILGDDNALKYLGPRLAKEAVPVVYLGINNNPRSYFETAPHNFTSVLERTMFKRSIASLAKIIKPRPKKVLVLFDAGTTAKAAVSEAFDGDIGINVFGVDAKLRLIKSWVEWKVQVSKARQHGYDAIIMGLYHTITDLNGKNVPADQVMSWTVEHSRVPLFSFWDFSVGKGKAIGGLVLSGEEQGRLAGSIAGQILNGASPEKIYPKTAEQGRYLFSRSMLDRYGVVLPDSINALSALID